MINESRAHDEQDGRRHQERQESLFLVFIKPRRHKYPDLGGDNRKRQKSTRKKRQFQISEKSLGQPGINQPPVFSLKNLRQRLDQKGINVPGKLIAKQTGENEGRKRINQAAAQFEQVRDEGHLGGFVVGRCIHDFSLLKHFSDLQVSDLQLPPRSAVQFQTACFPRQACWLPG